MCVMELGRLQLQLFRCKLIGVKVLKHIHKRAILALRAGRCSYRHVIARLPTVA